MIRDCNICKHHIQGATLDDVPSMCWDCSRSLMDLPAFEPLEGINQETLKVKLEDALADASKPLRTQVGGDHYKDMVIQPIEFAMKNNLNACQAKVVKYVCRTKGGIQKKLEDLDKAIHIIGIYKQMLVEGHAT